MNEKIQCWNCDKTFAQTLKGNVLVTPSTGIEFVADDEAQVEILCNRCKKRTSLIFK